MSQERVGIIVEVQGGNEALSLMRQLDSAIKKLNGQKIKFDFGGKEVQGLVSATQQTQKLGNEMVQTSTKTRTLGQAMRTTFNRISSSTMHIGQQMQVLGKTMTQISSPFRTFMRSTVWAAGFKALDTAMSGFSGAFERYDTMQNYAKSLNALGLDADKTFKVFANQKEAMTAIDNLNESVQGLPTGLDEIVAAQKIYAGATGEMVKSTKTAIAANNTFLASGTNAREQRFIQRYLASLASGAELTTTQWQSMSRIAPLAMRAVAEELGYAGDKYQDFIKDVSNGTIAGQEFLDTFIEVGTNGKVQQAANVMKTTWAGLAANVQNATKRMGEGILKALDDAFVSLNGRNFVQNLLGFDAEGNEVGGGIKHWINDISASVQDWIRANPDKILDFFESLKSIDIKGFLKGAAEGVREMVNLYKSMIDLFSGMGMENIGKWMVRFSWMGRGLNIAGGFLKGSRGIIASIGTLLAIPALKKGATGGGLFGMLGKALGTETLDGRKIAKMKRATEALPTIGQTLRGVVASLAGVMKIAGTIGIAAGTGFVAFKAFKSMIADLDEMAGMIKGMDWTSANEALTAMGVFLASFATLGTVLGGTDAGGVILGGEIILGAITTVASAFAALDMKLLKSAFGSFKDITESLGEALENVSNLESVTINKNAIKGAVESLATVYELLKPKYQGQGIENMSAREAGRMKEAVSSMVQTLKSLGELKDVASDLSGFEVFSEELSTNVQGAFKSLGTMFSGFTEAFGLSADTNTRAASKIIGNIKNTLDNLVGEGGVLNQIKQIAPAISEITSLTDQGSALIEARSGMDRLFTEIGNMFEGFAGKIGFNAEGNTSLASKVMENVKGMFDMLIGENGVISQISNLAPALKGIVNSTSLNGASPLQDAQMYLQSLFESIGQMYQDITTLIKPYVTAQSGENNNQIMESVQSMLGMFLGENGIVTQISQLAPMLNELVNSGGLNDMSPLQSFELYMQSLFTSLGNLYESFSGTSLGDAEGMTAFTESIGQLPSIMDNIQQAVTKVSEMQAVLEGMTLEGGAFSAIEQIKNMLAQLSQAFSVEQVAILQAQITGFINTMNSLFATITSMQGMSAGNPIELSITFTHTITGADEVVSAIQQADSAIRSAVNAIRTSYTKTITITLSPKVNRLPMPDTSYYPHTGGYIGRSGLQYRAKGGSIFKKRGSDIVPAMLTPGEYVQNKKAVDFFGIDFMRKVNNLDYKGALNSLLNKAGAMAKSSTGTTINNTYNNNQKVVINGADVSNAGYTFKRASRFVGAI